MNRDAARQQVEDSGGLWDVIVIGGGATGLGAAVEAAARGYQTVLLEQADFSKGTSSRSTKLVHGGVRYLRQGNISLVVEGLRERGLLWRNAPHLVHARPFVIPCSEWWQPAFYGAGLKLYDTLSGRRSLGPSRLLSRDQALAQIPNLAPDRLRGGVLYYDGQFDDSRLAISLAQTLSGLGGAPLNYFKVVELLKSSGRIDGVRALDIESGKECLIRGRAVINATGVFSDQVLRLDEPDAAPILTLSQGIHVVFDRSFLQGDAALMVPKTDDGRVLFAIPWLDKVIAGTTDTAVTLPSLEPRAHPEEIDFVLSHAARYLARAPARSDVTSVFTGLRPLLRNVNARRTSAISRDFAVLFSPSGLVTISGGKWTIYRKMGEAVIDQAAAAAGLEKRASRTGDLRIHGWTESADPRDPLAVYGSDAGALRALIAAEPALGERLHRRLPYLQAQVVWSARQEMARTLEDILARRTRALFLDAAASQEAAPGVAELLARELGRDRAWQLGQVKEYSELARGYLAV